MKRLAKVVPVGLALIVLATTSAGAQAGRDAALLKAAEAGDAARIQELLASGADINARDEHGRTPLMIAAVKGHAPAVTLLLDKGSDIAAKNKYGGSALQFAAGTGRAEVVRVLLERGANAREREAGTGDVPVIRAAASGSVDTVAALLARGADVNEKNSTGSTALMRATMNGRSEMVLFLLKNGADGTAKDEKGHKALGTLGAPRCISLDAAGALKEHGAYEPAEIQRALFNAVIGPASCTEVVKFLVERGADVNAQTANGDTALILAAVWGHTEAVRFFLSRNADVSLRNKDGKTALDEAKNNDIRQLLRNARRP